MHAERGADTGQHEWLFWAPDLDASIVQVQAEQVSPSAVGAFDMTRFAANADLLRDARGHEWLLIADAVGHVQLEVTHGTLAEGPALLHFDVTGFRTFSAKLKTLARLDALHRIGRFPRALFPPETGAAKWTRALQAYDGMCAGASHREIAVALFGDKLVRDDWNGRSDYLHSQVRRLLGFARRMVDGGYKSLLQ